MDGKWWIAGLCLGVAAAVGWSVTEAIKSTVLRRHRTRQPPWWAPLLVFLSITIGAAAGALVASVEWEPIYGAAVGAVGGAFSAWIVRVAKRWVRRKLGDTK